MKKITLEKVCKEYINDDVCMGELLSSMPATGLTIEEAFYLYVMAMNIAEEDRFIQYADEEERDLVKEAKNMEL